MKIDAIIALVALLCFAALLYFQITEMLYYGKPYIVMH